jgi:hypothetical protein
VAYLLPQTTAELLLRAAEAAYVLGPDATTEQVATFLGGSDTHAEPALVGAVQLGFVSGDASNGKWSATPLARLLAMAPPAAKTVLLRFQLEQFPPYSLFRNRLIAGEGPLDAARQTCLKHDLALDPLDAEGVLKNWGTYSGGLLYGEDQRLLVAIDEAVLKKAVSVYANVVAERDSVRAHVIEKLGVDAAAFATGEVLDRLIDAYLTILEEGPLDEAMFHLGHALEGFVKGIAEIDPAVQLPAGANTIGSVANALKDDGRLLKKHHAIVTSLTAVRNAADHSADPEIGGATWEITRETAISACALTWSLMRSFFAARAQVFEL